MISDALVHPLKGSGKYILVIGAVLSLLLSVATYVPILGLILGIGASGFLAAYMFKVINTTVTLRIIKWKAIACMSRRRNSTRL